MCVKNRFGEHVTCSIFSRSYATPLELRWHAENLHMHWVLSSSRYIDLHMLLASSDGWKECLWEVNYLLYTVWQSWRNECGTNTNDKEECEEEKSTFNYNVFFHWPNCRVRITHNITYLRHAIDFFPQDDVHMADLQRGHLYLRVIKL